MNKLNVFFLIFISNNFLFSMEAERKSLASFFNVNAPDINEDISQIIAGHYISNHQWWYLDKQLQHEGHVKSACFNKSGTEILTGARKDQKSLLCIWDSCTGTQVVRKEIECSLKTAMFGEMQKEIIIVEKGSRKLLFAVRDKDKIILDFYLSQPMFGSFSCVNNEKTEMLELIHREDRGSTISVRSFTGPIPIQDIRQNKFICSAKFNSSGNEIITMDADGTLRIFDKNNAGLLFMYKCYFPLASASFNQKGNEFLMYGDCPNLYVHSRENGKMLMKIQHPENVHFACFNNNDDQICTITEDNVIRIWDRNTGKVVAQLYKEGSPFKSLELNGDGTKIVGALDDCACVWSRYDNYTLPQILLKKMLNTWLVLKRQSKQINSSEKLLDEIANGLLCVKSDLEKAWLSFSKDMQQAIWSSVHRQIQKYGK